MVYGANPQSVLENPARDLIRSIPSVWDETLVLPPSAVGEIAAFARRSRDRWFVGVLNGPNARSLELSLGFLGKGKYRATLARDKGRTAGHWRSKSERPRATTRSRSPCGPAVASWRASHARSVAGPEPGRHCGQESRARRAPLLTAALDGGISRASTAEPFVTRRVRHPARALMTRAQTVPPVRSELATVRSYDGRTMPAELVRLTVPERRTSPAYSHRCRSATLHDRCAPGASGRVSDGRPGHSRHGDGTHSAVLHSLPAPPRARDVIILDNEDREF